MRQLRIREEERGQIRQSEGADGRGRRVGGGRHVGLKFENPALYVQCFPPPTFGCGCDGSNKKHNLSQSIINSV